MGIQARLGRKKMATMQGTRFHVAKVGPSSPEAIPDGPQESFAELRKVLRELRTVLGSSTRLVARGRPGSVSQANASSR